MDILIRKNYEEMSKTAADIIAQQIRSNPKSVLGLATGSTPIGTYKELVLQHREENLDFSKILSFNLDEYLGISIDLEKPYEEDQSYARFMWEELFKHINIKKGNYNVPNGLTENPHQFCEKYEDMVKKAGGIDLQLLGIGGDGHVGFNEPGTSFASKTHVAALTKQTLDDNYDLFYKKSGIPRHEMPHFAITMGIGTILNSRHALLIANGERKADIIAKMIEGPLTSQITSTCLQMHPKVTVVLDKAAAASLKRVEHYKHVENLRNKYSL
ncbi:MAG: Glucosamine-6-phosphate deaminase [Promethearchaeota archaeon]|nr:MAG: Glucosamine-6-phosphate deaminase [Candidatus Lokiarchaeota archaeon]